MFDQMGMPVLFAVLISTLALVSVGVFVAIRVLATHSEPPARLAAGTDEPVASGPTVEGAQRPELD